MSVYRSYRCDDCYEKFSSKEQLELHKKKNNCGKANDSETEQPSTEAGRLIENGTQRSDIEGTVSEYNEEGGYGFLMTTDLAGVLNDPTRESVDVFFHISDADTSWVKKGDRLRCDVKKGDRGLKCINIEVIMRDKDRHLPESEKSDTPNVGFGQQKDDSKKNTKRKPSTTNSDIEDFKDERKFR